MKGKRYQLKSPFDLSPKVWRVTDISLVRDGSRTPWYNGAYNNGQGSEGERVNSTFGGKIISGV